MKIEKAQIRLWGLPGLMILLMACLAYAHCDGLDGPVVKAAQRALETGNIDGILIWVQKADEPQIKAAFQRTLAIRKLNPEAREFADMYFFETVVRIHRSGEGAPFTGLKPAGRDLGPAIPSADRAIDTGSSEALSNLLAGTVREQIDKRFRQVMELSKYPKNDIEAGRKYVKAYVEYIHYVERIYDASKSSPEGHYSEPDAENIHRD